MMITDNEITENELLESLANSLRVDGMPDYRLPGDVTVADLMHRTGISIDRARAMLNGMAERGELKKRYIVEDKRRVIAYYR